MGEFCLSKNDTAVLKSIGIFLIVFSHALGYPEWYANGFSFVQLNDYTGYIRHFMMYAYVPMFAFLTGYTYKLKEDLSWRYVLKKIIGFLLDYYFIFTLLFMLAFFFCDYIPSVSQFSKELYPISATLMIFAWYVPFYCEAMLTLRFLGIFVKKYDIKKSIYVCIFVFLVLEVLIGTLKNIGLRGDMLVKALQDFKRYVPFVMMGYFFAHGKYFNSISQKWGG